MSAAVMNYLVIFCAGLLFIAALIITYQTAKGPTILDRMVCIDMLTSILIGGFALLAAATRRADLLPVFVALGIIGFLGSTTLARFAPPLSNATRKSLLQDSLARAAACGENVAQPDLMEAQLHGAGDAASSRADLARMGEMVSRPESDVRVGQKHVDGYEDRG